MGNGNTATDTNEPETLDNELQSANDYFGYEGQTETPSETATPEKMDYQAEVNSLLKETKVTEDGKFEFPANTPGWAKVAISNEKKFRDTQSGFTKATQENRLLESENTVLKSKLAKSTALTAEQSDELEHLKVTDPEAYFDKRTEYESQAHTQFDTELKDVRQKTAGEIELARRDQYVIDFNVGRTIPITQELIDNEVPAKFFKQLVANEVTFDVFMSNVAKYVDTPKVLGNTDKEVNVTNLSDVAGSEAPSEEKRYANLAKDYAKIVF